MCKHRVLQLDTVLTTDGNSCINYKANTKEAGPDLYASFRDAINKNDHKPCANFYNYACKEFDEAYKNKKEGGNRYHLLRDVVNAQKKELVMDASLGVLSGLFGVIFKDKMTALQKMVKFRDYCLKEPEHDPETCFEHIEKYFQMVVDHLYLKKYWVTKPKEEIDLINKIIDNVVNSWGAMIDSNKDWLRSDGQKFWKGADPVTNEQVHDNPYEHAKRKLRNMKRVVGAYPEMLNCRFLDDMYKDYKIDETLSFNKTIENLQIQKFRMSDQSFDNPIQKSYYRVVMGVGSRPTRVNARYGRPYNTIIINAAILQRPFFDIAYPDAVNYGRIGRVIGHEITHGFDDGGYKYDAYGEEKMWMGGKAFDEFKKRVEQVRKSYEMDIAMPPHFHSTNLRINGAKTSEENIADQGGIRVAHHALLNLKERRPIVADPKFMSEYQIGDNTPWKTLEKLFFTSFATCYCDSRSHSNNKEVLEKQLEDDSHSPSFARVNMVLANNPDFTNLYKCSHDLHKTMIPDEQVSVWTYQTPHKRHVF